VEGLDGLNETQPQYIWKQFNIHKIKVARAAGARLPGGRSRVRSPTVDVKGGAVGGAVKSLLRKLAHKKQGAAGITTAAPYVAG